MKCLTWIRTLVSASTAMLVLLAPAWSQEDITVFAAASLQNALEDVARQYQQKAGRSVRFSFAASSALARQIEQGAPAAIFISADEQWMDYLAQRKLIVPDTRKSLLGNRLVMVVPSASTATVDLKPGFDMKALLGADGRWVTGDPSGVPVGRYAQEALTKLGVWDFAQTRMVRAENVRVALCICRAWRSGCRRRLRDRCGDLAEGQGGRCVPRRQLRASQLPGRDRRRQGQRGCARLLALP